MALSEPSGPSASRRDFVKTSSLVATGTLFSVLNSHQGVHAAGDDILKVGLIGCGGRGTGAATQALMADSRVKLTAMADVFEDENFEEWT